MYKFFIVSLFVLMTLLLYNSNCFQKSFSLTTLSKNVTNSNNSSSKDRSITFSPSSPLVSVTIDKFNNIFVADSSNHKIQKFDSKGKFLTIWGSTGTGDGQFTGHLTISYDQYGSIFIADSGNHNIQQFNNEGKFIRSFKF